MKKTAKFIFKFYTGQKIVIKYKDQDEFDHDWGLVRASLGTSSEYLCISGQYIRKEKILSIRVVDFGD